MTTRRAPMKTQRYLQAKEAAAIELYRGGKISRSECFRHEVDRSINEDSGPIKMKDKP